VIRKEINPEVKARAVIDLLSGEKMLSEVANKYGIVPRTLENWRKEFLDNAHRAFTLTKDEKALDQARKDAYIQEKALIQKIGQLTMELDWCKKKVKESGFMGKKGTPIDR
jgi:transposase-like protein